MWLFDMDLSAAGPEGLVIFLVGMFLNAAIIGALVLALVLRFGQRAEVAAWAFSYLMLLLCGLYYPVSRPARGGPVPGAAHPLHLFSGIFPPLLRLSPELPASPALRLRGKCDIHLDQLRPAPLHPQVRL